MSYSLLSVSQEVNRIVAKGFSSDTAVKLIESEQAVAGQCDLVLTKCLTPDLIDSFGEQHVERIIPEAYEQMITYDISDNIIEQIINTMLQVRRPEEISHNPERIRNFVSSLFDRINITTLEDDEIKDLLSDLTEDEIRAMSDTDYDPDIIYGDDEAGEEY